MNKVTLYVPSFTFLFREKSSPEVKSNYTYKIANLLHTNERISNPTHVTVEIYFLWKTGALLLEIVIVAVMHSSLNPLTVKKSKILRTSLACDKSELTR